MSPPRAPRSLVATLALPLLLGACATLSAPAPDPLARSPRPLSRALSELAADPSPTPAALAARARLKVALGRASDAAESWFSLAEAADDPMARAWAAHHLRALLEHVPPAPAWLERVSRLPLELPLSELHEALALRLSDPAALATARARLGVAWTWRRTPRLLRYPGATTSPPIDPSRFSPAPAPATAGLIASPEEGPGLYAFLLDLPPGEHHVVVDSDDAVSAFSGGARLVVHDTITAALPRRLAFSASLAPGQPLELHLVTRSAVAQARVFVLPPPAPAPMPSSPALASLTALAAFELTLAHGDVAAAHAHLAALPPDTPLTLLCAALLASHDPTRAPERARAAAKRDLAAALALEPAFLEAREHLARLHADDGELDDALRSLGDDHAAIGSAAVMTLALIDPGRAADLAERLLAARPTSCRAQADWLDTGWDRVRLRPDAVTAIFDRPLAPSPGLCLDTRLRAVDLLRDAFALSAAQRVLAPLIAADSPLAGPARARAELHAARLALSRADWAGAAEHARLALAQGGADPAARELLARALRLQGGPPASALDPARDLGLPLSDARALILAHLAAGRAARPGGDDPAGREILLDDRFVRVAADGSLRVRVHRLVRVNAVDAVDAVGELAIPDDAEVLLVRTWKVGRAGRALRPLEPEDILEKATVSLPDLAPGDFAEWAYFHPIAASPRLAPGWRAPAFAFDSDEGPVGTARFSLSLAPGARPPVFVVDDALPPPARPDPSTWVFSATDLPRVFVEPLDPRPELRMTTLAASSGVERLPLAAALAAEIAALTRGSPALEALIAEASASLPEAADPERLLHALYDLVRRTIDEPASATPFDVDASWIAERRRGSRALLLTALCRHAGLACELVLARPLWEGPEPREVELERLSYPLVRWAPPGRPARWLDPTSRWMPFALLPPALEGVFGLSLGARAATSPGEPDRVLAPALTETPGLLPDAEGPVDPTHWGERAIDLRVTFDPAAGRALVEGHERLDGVFASSWRTALNGMSEEARTRVLGALVEQCVPAARVELSELAHLDDDTRPLTLRWRASTSTRPADPPERGARSLVLALFPEGLTQDTVVMPERATPLLVNRAARMRVTLTLTAPEGWAFSRAPVDLAIDFDLGRLERVSRFEDLGRTVVIDKRFLLRPGVIEPARYPAWSDAAVAIDRADLVELVLAPARPQPRGPR